MKFKIKNIKFLWLKNKKLFSTLLFLIFLSLGAVLIITIPNKLSAHPFDFGVNQGAGLTETLPVCNLATCENCTYLDDTNCGCNSVSYDGDCNETICNQYNDLDCRRLIEIPDDITTELPQVIIFSPRAGIIPPIFDLSKWANQDLVLHVGCTVEDSVCQNTYLKEITSSESCPNKKDNGTPNDSSDDYQLTPPQTATDHSYWCAGGEKDGLFGVSAKTEIKIDKENPVIASFTSDQETTSIVAPVCGENGDKDVVLRWTVSDVGGSGLNRINVWRANLNPDNSCPGGGLDWNNVGQDLSPGTTDWTDANITLPTNQPAFKGYCYGIHVTDNAENEIDERYSDATHTPPQPIKVEVVDCTPKTVTLTKNDKYYGYASMRGVAEDDSIVTKNCNSPACGSTDKVSAELRYNSEATLSFIAPTDSDFTFDHWTGVDRVECLNGTYTSGNCTDIGPKIFITNNNRDIVAHFNLIKHNFTLNIEGSGTVSASAVNPPETYVVPDISIGNLSNGYNKEVRNRTSITLTATATNSETEHNIFDHWEINGEVSAETSTTLNVGAITQDTTVKAVFLPVYSLCKIAIPSTLGEINDNNIENDLSDKYPTLCSSCSGAGKECAVYKKDTLISLSGVATTSSGIFKDWAGDNCGGSTNSICSFAISGNNSITANFDPIVTLKLIYDDTKVLGFDTTAKKTVGGEDQIDRAEPGSICYGQEDRHSNRKCFRYQAGTIFSMKNIVLAEGYRITDWTRNWRGSSDPDHLETMLADDRAWANLGCDNLTLKIPEDNGDARLTLTVAPTVNLDVYRRVANSADITLENFIYYSTAGVSDGYGYNWPVYTGSAPSTKTFTGATQPIHVKYDKGLTATIKVNTASLPAGVTVAGWYFVDPVLNPSATAISGCTTAGVTPTCVVTMDSDKKVYVKFKQAFTVTVNRTEGKGNVKFLTDSPNKDCGTICSSSYDSGTSVSLLAGLSTPLSNWVFKNWSVASGTLPCNANNSTCVINNLSSSINLTATFKDAVAPKVVSFNYNTPVSKCVNGSSGKADFKAVINDGDGSGVGNIELWRSSDGSNWNVVSGAQAVKFSDGVTFSISKTGVTPGNYLYGIHVKDETTPPSNCSTEGGLDCNLTPPSGGIPTGISPLRFVVCAGGRSVCNPAGTACQTLDCTPDTVGIDCPDSLVPPAVCNPAHTAKLETYTTHTCSSSGACTNGSNRIVTTQCGDIARCNNDVVCALKSPTVTPGSLLVTPLGCSDSGTVRISSTATSGMLTTPGTTWMEYWERHLLSDGSWTVWRQIPSGTCRSYASSLATTTFACDFNPSSAGLGDAETFEIGVHVTNSNGKCITEKGKDCDGSDPADDAPRTALANPTFNFCKSTNECVSGACSARCPVGQIRNSSGTCVPAGYVFVTGGTPSITSSMSNGVTQGRITATVGGINYIGYAAADKICNNLANNAGLPGNYKAWLSGGDGSVDHPIYSPVTSPTDVSIYSRINGWFVWNVPYYLTDGNRVSANRAGVLGGGLERAINLSENKITISNGTVWTGTNVAGTKHATNDNTSDDHDYQCGVDWDTTLGDIFQPSNSFNHSGIGSTLYTTLNWTKDINMSDDAARCDIERHLYCFQTN